MNEQSFSRHLGVVLKQVRNRSGLTQQALEDRTGIQRGFISDLECGRKGISVYKLAQLCQGFENMGISKLLEQVEGRLEKYED